MDGSTRNAGPIAQLIPCRLPAKSWKMATPLLVKSLFQARRGWERQVPQWAQGRRAEISGRIAELFGANRGGRVEFMEAD